MTEVQFNERTRLFLKGQPRAARAQWNIARGAGRGARGGERDADGARGVGRDADGDADQERIKERNISFFNV